MANSNACSGALIASAERGDALPPYVSEAWGDTVTVRNAAAIATLAEGIQQLVGHMRAEQQQMRDWVDVQASQQEDIGKLLRRLLDELGTR